MQQHTRLQRPGPRREPCVREVNNCSGSAVKTEPYFSEASVCAVRGLEVYGKNTHRRTTLILP